MKSTDVSTGGTGSASREIDRKNTENRRQLDQVVQQYAHFLEQSDSAAFS